MTRIFFIHAMPEGVTYNGTMTLGRTLYLFTDIKETKSTFAVEAKNLSTSGIAFALAATRKKFAKS